MIKSFSIAAFILFCFALFEAAILSNMMFLPAIPDFLLIISLYLSINNGRMYGVTTGFMAGVILDFLTVSPFGLHSLLRTIIGYIGGLFNKTLNLNGIFLPMVIGFSATFLKAFILWLISLFFLAINSYNLISISFLFELAANTILTPFVFKFLGIFQNNILLDAEKVS